MCSGQTGKGLMIYEMVEVDMLSVLILFNDPRIGFVFTKQGVVWLHTVLQTRFPMMSDDGNGLNMLDAARYSLDPCIHFITHLPLPSEVFFRLS